MARSVSVLSNWKKAWYLDFQSGPDDEWTDLVECIISCFDHLPSLAFVAERWDGREVQIILENEHCEIGVSEYLGVVSLGIRVKFSEHTNIALADNWIESVLPKIDRRLRAMFRESYLVKIGAFSDGSSIYKRQSKEQ